MLGMALTLRSRTVEGVYQEIWGALIAYNLIQLEMAEAELEAKLEPTDLSFVRTLHTIQYEMMWAAATRAQASCLLCCSDCVRACLWQRWKNDGGVNAPVSSSRAPSATAFAISRKTLTERH
jgi:hypothetical protein